MAGGKAASGRLFPACIVLLLFLKEQTEIDFLTHIGVLAGMMPVIARLAAFVARLENYGTPGLNCGPQER